jgi:hypothetical protein
MDTPDAQSPQSGEAGQHGQDRQAQRHTTGNPPAPAPDPAKAATPGQARTRSVEAQKKPGPVDAPDFVHPGPNRYEAEKSKGDLHHKQHEPEPDMQDEVEEL